MQRHYTKVTVKIPIGCWCINPKNHHRCKFYNTPGHIFEEIGEAECGLYSKTWIVDENKPIKLIECYNKTDCGYGY